MFFLVWLGLPASSPEEMKGEARFIRLRYYVYGEFGFERRYRFSIKKSFWHPLFACLLQDDFFCHSKAIVLYILVLNAPLEGMKYLVLIETSLQVGRASLSDKLSTILNARKQL